MGELPCLRRSFSQPSGGFREAKEGDPFRALGESVSFGRFLTDSLAWERWSAFSHNRYLEEVEKFAKPGSVAEKKAYFEAHYKRKAAERAAALLEAANVVTTSNVVEQPATEDKKRNDSLMESDMVKGEIDVGEQQDKDVASNVTICPSNSNLCVERNEPDVSELEGGGGGVAIQESMDVESSNPVEISIPPENNVDLNKIESTTEENMLGSEEARDQEIIASASKKRSSSSSSKSTSQNKAYKTLLSPAKQMTHVQTTKANNLASRSKNFVEDMVNKKNAKSLHMSIHFSSHSGGESSKTTSPIIQKIKSLKNFTASLSVSKNNSASSQTKTKASVNELKRPSLNLKSEDRSNRPMLNKSVAGGIIADQKRNSPSKENSKSPNGRGSKPRSSLITSPFSLRSEERAAKRKEARLKTIVLFIQSL
ncbi:protein WVD2-like 7 [Morus notabilis]|uniref:protein WVD2-like 7 n=1 Tax=Morus notabilis TaxID=981085 RepID=UPI000CED2945|nr:protein WVD2-like 7 [Morus notabilis]